MGRGCPPCRQIADKLKAESYFAHPNAAWECGSDKSVKALIRQYFFKTQSFENIIEDEIELVMNLLNNRPRKYLDFKTPFDLSLYLSVALNT